MKVFDSIDAILAAVGQPLGASDWVTLTQERVNTFADATDDHQWIHVDPERAANGPYGTTIAHGYLTLSLVPILVQQIYKVDGLSMQVNYGVDKLRFPAPVPVGSSAKSRWVGSFGVGVRRSNAAVRTAPTATRGGGSASRCSTRARQHC